MKILMMLSQGINSNLEELIGYLVEKANKLQPPIKRNVLLAAADICFQHLAAESHYA